MNDAPNFLVEWPSRWDEFLTAIGPAMGKSPKRLAGEAQVGLFPWWGILLSWAVELLLLVAVIVVPAKLASMQPYEPPPKPKYDIIYYSEQRTAAHRRRRRRGGGPLRALRRARGASSHANDPGGARQHAAGNRGRRAQARSAEIQFRGGQPAGVEGASRPGPGGRHAVFVTGPGIDPDRSRSGSTGTGPAAGHAPAECRRSPAQRGSAPARSLHSSSARIECGASGSASGFGPGADDEPESAAHHAGAERGRAAAHHDSGGGDDGTGLRARRTAESSRSARRAGRQRLGRTPQHQRLGQHIGGASHRATGRGCSRAIHGWRLGYRHSDSCGAATSIGLRRRFTHRPRHGKSRRRVGRTAGRRPGGSASQQQWRWQHLRRGGFQPARFEGWPARQRRKRRPGDVSLGRRQGRPGRIGRRRRHRTRRWTRQRLLRPRARAPARKALVPDPIPWRAAVSRPFPAPAAPAREPAALQPCPESR